MHDRMTMLTSGPADAALHLLLAHGAGAGAATPFMTSMAALLATRGWCVHRFEFAYMAARTAGGKRKPPPRADTLQGEYEAAIAAVARHLAGDAKLFIGGKSMGGRVASLIADREHAAGRVAGLVCLGYPFHPTGKPEHLRTAHLAAMTCPALIVQGERDPFGTRDEVAGYALAPGIAVAWIDDGDHDFGPRGNSGFTRKSNLAAAADAVTSFAAKVSA